MNSPIIGLSAWTRSLDTREGHGERHYSIGGVYVEAVTDAGGVPVVLPSIDPGFAIQAVSRLDAVIISGGNDIDPALYGATIDGSVDPDPPRDAWELALIHAARTLGVPLLGICRGAQLLNVAYGGTLIQHIWDARDDHPALWIGQTKKIATGMHEVEFEPDSRFAAIYGTERRTVNSLHHQALDRIGRGLRVVGTAPDGTVEAIEAVDGWEALAVQWHPERLDLADERPLFEAFVRLASERSQRASAGQVPSDVSQWRSVPQPLRWGAAAG
jgi:putative glutamine amidotransferase